MRKRNANVILKSMLEILILYLEELSDGKDIPNEQFLYGEKVAYAECLGWIQYWKKAQKYGGDFDIEKRYP